jgi:hypothetical protein
MIDNDDEVSKVLFRGQKVSLTAKDVISSVTFDSSTTAVTEIALTIEDPLFKMLKTGMFDLETPVTYRKTKLQVAVIETDAGGGQGGVVVRCRPVGVDALKKLRGPRVMNNVSPSEYVIAECKSANVTCVVEPSKKKGKVARDVKQKGQKYEESNYPSAWTTFQRLATEIGYLMYEVNGVVYFGKPTWLVDKNPTLLVEWNTVDGKEPYTVPQFRHSLDSKDIELSLELPLARVDEVAPGYGIKVTGFPKFAGTYFVTGISYPLAGPGTINVTASTVRNPEVQKSGEQ